MLNNPIETTLERAANILAVDDNLVNLQLLGSLLKTRGYTVRPVTSGALALQAARSEPPDLILLDINMPEMDGYTVCEILKADQSLREIPVIFISALNDTSEKVRAFHCGGADYVTKPFREEEIYARIEVHLALHRQKRSLKESYDKLQVLESMRDSLVHMIVHDMNSPITIIMGVLEMLADSDQAKLDDSQKEWVEIAQESAQKLGDMVSQLLAVSRLESGEMPLDKMSWEVDELVRTSLQALTAGVTNRGRLVTTELPQGIHLLCDRNLVQRVIGNLISNALKFTPENGEVKVSVSSENQMVRVSVADNGSGIPPEFHEKIFEKFGQVGAKKGKLLGTGLGLSFCRLAIEAHGGQIGVISEPGAGSVFWFTLPLSPSAS